MNYIASIYSTIAKSKRLKNKTFPATVAELYQKLAELHEETPKLPVGAAVSHIFASLPLKTLAACTFYGEQAVANLEKLRQQAELLGREGLNHAQGSDSSASAARPRCQGRGRKRARGRESRRRQNHEYSQSQGTWSFPSWSWPDVKLEPMGGMPSARKRYSIGLRASRDYAWGGLGILPDFTSQRKQGLER